MARRRHLDGLDDALRIFDRASRDGVERVVDAVNRGAIEIRDRAREAAPVGDYSGAGGLRRSVDVEATTARARRDGGGIVATVFAGGTPDTASAARAQEFGRAPGPGDHPGHAAQPFFFSAYHALRRRVVSRIRRALSRAAREAVRRG